MVANEHAALRLAHPTVIPDADGEESGEQRADGENSGEQRTDVDVTGSHPTVRATTLQGD